MAVAYDINTDVNSASFLSSDADLNSYKRQLIAEDAVKELNFESTNKFASVSDWISFMSLSYSVDCPHCGIKNCSFTFKYKYSLTTADWRVLYACNACSEAIVLQAESTYAAAIGQDVGDISKNKSVFINGSYPSKKKDEAPAYVPDSVSKCYLEACEIIKPSPRGACVMFRKTLEMALKSLSPDIEAWKLEKRIDKMAEQGLLTKDLQEWAHHLRLDGNEMAHEGESEVNDAQLLSTAEQMRELTYFVLIYVFSLPAQVKAARAAG